MKTPFERRVRIRTDIGSTEIHTFLFVPFKEETRVHSQNHPHPLWWQPPSKPRGHAEWAGSQAPGHTWPDSGARAAHVTVTPTHVLRQLLGLGPQRPPPGSPLGTRAPATRHQLLLLPPAPCPWNTMTLCHSPCGFPR